MDKKTMSIASLFLLMTILLINISKGEYSSEDCKYLGFNKAILVCSTCKHFANKTKDVSKSLIKIKENCDNCCVKDDDINDMKKFAKATLEVCTCKFNAYPQVQAFVKNHPEKKYKNLDIKYVKGLDPILKLFNNKGQLVDHLDIHKWDTDTIDEFLKTYLAKN